MPTITDIVFDVGNVLFAYDPSQIIRNVVGDTPHHSAILEHLFLSPAWQAMDRGDTTIDQVVQSLAKNQSVSPDALAHFFSLEQQFHAHLSPIFDMIQLFKQLAQTKRVWVLSNFQDAPFDRLVAMYPFFHLAKGWVVSAKVNMMKPEPAIYRYLIQTAQLTPNQTVFIDDLPANILAAADHGIAGILYQSPQQVCQALDQLGVRI